MVGSGTAVLLKLQSNRVRLVKSNGVKLRAQQSGVSPNTIKPGLYLRIGQDGLLAEGEQQQNGYPLLLPASGQIVEQVKRAFISPLEIIDKENDRLLSRPRLLPAEPRLQKFGLGQNRHHR